jgi:hypothetical protein
MAERRTGLSGSDRSQDHLQDARHGSHDPIGNLEINQQTAHERAQPGADVRGAPIPGNKMVPRDNALPEGLRRERKGPLNKSYGRGGEASHVPSHNPRPRSGG